MVVSATGSSPYAIAFYRKGMRNSARPSPSSCFLLHRSLRASPRSPHSLVCASRREDQSTTCSQTAIFYVSPPMALPISCTVLLSLLLSFVNSSSLQETLFRASKLWYWTMDSKKKVRHLQTVTEWTKKRKWNLYWRERWDLEDNETMGSFPAWGRGLAFPISVKFCCSHVRRLSSTSIYIWSAVSPLNNR